MFLKISRKSQENNCARVAFNKVSGWRLAALFKERLRRRFFSPVNVEEFSKGLVKPIQHFIQHKKMPCWMKCWIGLTERKNSKKKKKKKKSCWIKENRFRWKFDSKQIFPPKFSGSFNTIFMLDRFTSCFVTYFILVTSFQMVERRISNDSTKLKRFAK